MWWVAVDRPNQLFCAERKAGYDLAPGVHLPAPMGIGCWSWGNTAFWNDTWTDADEAEARGAYRCVSAWNLVPAGVCGRNLCAACDSQGSSTHRGTGAAEAVCAISPHPSRCVG